MMTLNNAQDIEVGKSFLTALETLQVLSIVSSQICGAEAGGEESRTNQIEIKVLTSKNLFKRNGSSIWVIFLLFLR